MSLESILEYILAEAGLEADKIIQQANLEADKTIQEAKKEAEIIYREALVKEKTLYEKQKQKLLVEARLESKKDLLQARQELINEALEKLKFEIKKDKLKKYRVLSDKIEEVHEDIDFYLEELRLKYETEIAKILFT